MSIRNLIESAIKGDAVSFNETFNEIMGESIVSAIDEENNPVEFADVIETLLNLGVVTVEEMEAEDFTEETLLELSKKTLGNYIKKADENRAANRLDVSSVYHNEKRLDTNLIKKDLKRSNGIKKAVDKLTKEDLNNDEEIVHEGKSYRRGDEKYDDVKKLKKGAANLRADRKNKRQVEEEVSEDAIELDEVSKKLLGRYIKNSKAHLAGNALGIGMAGAKGEHDKDAEKKFGKRNSGIDKATDKLTGSAKVNAKD